MKKVIKITENQFNNYLNRKRTKKMYNEIASKLDDYKEHLNPNLPIDKITNEIVDSYRDMGLLTEDIEKQLIKNGYILKSKNKK